jgi:hypothetical protein
MFEADVGAGERVSMALWMRRGAGLFALPLARTRACQVWIAKADESEPPMADAVVGFFGNRSREA